eukprot:364927-Chlamydomonas_euryale.AAC.19
MAIYEQSTSMRMFAHMVPKGQIAFTSLYSQFTYGVKMTGVAANSGLLTGGPRPPRQKPSHSIILTGIPTRTTTH